MNYTSDGEMGDWLEAKKNILSITIEIGDKSKTSKSFYPDNISSDQKNNTGNQYQKG